jgi:hypothetical protein
MGSASGRSDGAGAHCVEMSGSASGSGGRFDQGFHRDTSPAPEMIGPVRLIITLESIATSVV